ncbi:6-phosphofructo-2-kinase [Aureococcus anophagefferens]|nr:6-phosphofructo-2-kinase [Aureococcus anophagefferens]
MTELAGRLTVSNPVPQLPPGASSPRDNAALLHVAPNKSKYSTPSDKIVLILVGLPARGKTFVARKVHRYLEFFHAVNVRLFNIGNYRRKLLGDHHPAECAWLAEENDGRVAILDGTHSTLAKRNYAYDKLRKLDCKVIFLESICSDRDVVERNIVSCKLGTPDYVGMSERDAVEDFRRRVAQYESNYETIDADCLDGAEQPELDQDHRLPPPASRPRRRAPKKLAEFCVSEVTKAPDGSERPARLWTSTMRRTRETAAYIAHEKTHIDYEGDDVGHAQEWVQLRPIAWSNLDEIFAGVCDGMTYAEIEEHYPQEFKRRQDDKLAYRCPRGESYLDMIHRLDTMVHEMERHREPLLIVAHQGILRLLYACLMGLSREEAPYVSIPLNTVIRLQPKTCSCDEERLLLIAKPKKSDGQDEPAVARDDDPPSH